MEEVPKQSQAKLYPSELVTIGLLFALKGGHFRALYRWLKRDYEALEAYTTNVFWIQTIVSPPVGVSL